MLRKLLSRATGALASIPLPRFLRGPAYGCYARRYGAQLDEAERPIQEYRSFDAFFTRRLRPGCRPIDPSPDAIVSPVDGTISASGPIRGETLIQAKGIDYTLADLFARDPRHAAFRDGSFVTIYLAPGDCHRIFVPLDAKLSDLRHIGGTLFPVRTRAVESIPRLFARNERVVFHLETHSGPVALIMVGALNVGSIEPLHAPGAPLKKGGELAVFHLGSTVILLFPPRMTRIEGLESGDKVRIGGRLASLQT